MIETSAGERQEIRLSKLSDRPIPNNNVLVRIDVLPEDGYELKLKSGLVLEMAGDKWNESDRLSRFGVVENVPSRLIGRGESAFEGAMEWETDMELEKGDVVYFTKIGSANAPAIYVDDEVYLLIPYSEIILKNTNGILPLNGNCIVEKVTDKVKIEGLLLDFGDFENKQLGIVRYVGSPNKSYYMSSAVDADVRVGDKVVFQGNFWTELEADMFSTIDGELGFVQRNWIVAKL